jgi:hypothetical protein
LFSSVSWAFFSFAAAERASGRIWRLHGDRCATGGDRANPVMQPILIPALEGFSGPMLLFGALVVLVAGSIWRAE